MEVYEPAGLQPVYANHLVVAASENEFVLTFLQAVPPALLRQQDLQALSSIRATAVAKIIVSPPAMERLAKYILKNMVKEQAKSG